jgi:transposase-like protein
MAWTDEDKQKVIAAYKSANPTPETSTEIIKDIAEEMDQSPNGIRMILVQAGVYVKKEAATGGTTKKEGAEGTKRVSKESQIAALKAAIEDFGAEVDDEILDKLTGKAAAYFVKVLSK